MVYGYCRVSTRGQAKDGNSLEVQEKAVREAGAVQVYKDSFTGKQTERPQFAQLKAALQAGDTLIVTKLDRIARTATQGFELIQELLQNSISIHVLNMGLIDNTPAGKLITHVMLAFAEFERDMIIERTQEGKAIAKQNPDYREGRPKKFSKAQMQHALELLESHSYTQVENMTGISKRTLARARAEQKAKETG